MLNRFFIGICLPLILVINLIPWNAFIYAESKDEKSIVKEDVFLDDENYYLLSENETIPLFQEKDELKEIYVLPNDSQIKLLEDKDGDESSSYQLIYYESDEDFSIKGYVNKENIVDEETYNEKSAQSIEKHDETDNNDEEQGSGQDKEQSEIDESINQQEDSSEEIISNEQVTNEVNQEEEIEQELIEDIEEEVEQADEITEEPVDETEELEETQAERTMLYSTLSVKKLKGVAKKSPTNIRQKTSTKSPVIKKLPIGAVVHYEEYSKNWFRTSIALNGKTQYGYLHKKHVTTVTTVPKAKKGVAKKSPTNLRTGASTKSKVLTKLHIGEVVNYRTFSKNWNEVTVNINGKKEVGYLHRKHVTNISTKPKNTSLFTLKSPTNVRAGASTKSKVLTKLPKNQFVNVQTFSKNWYSYTTTINGKKETGYIHRKHADNIKSMKFKGVTAKDKTNIRQKASTKSKVLTSLPTGSVFEYTVHNNNWYKTTVTNNGGSFTGYIHKKHMIDTEYIQKTIWGQASKAKTNIRTDASTKSSILKRISQDEIVRLKTFTKDWYEVVVNVKGENRTGYIHRKHFTNVTTKTFTGVAAKKTTNIRTKASTKSNVLTSVKGGTTINYQMHNTNWYKTTVNQNGTAVTGYVHKKHMTTKKQRTVVVDPGHGGSDPGASGNGLREKDLTLDISKRVEKLLRNAGYNVIMTRSTDEFIELKNRTNIANNSGADIFLSIHINSYSNGSAQGIETWWYDKGPNPSESQKLAKEIQSALANEVNMNDRGIKNGNLHVNRESKLPSSLVELGFISSKSDTDKLKNNSFKDSLAKAIVQGIKNYFK